MSSVRLVSTAWAVFTAGAGVKVKSSLVSIVTKEGAIFGNLVARSGVVDVVTAPVCHDVIAAKCVELCRVVE